MELNPRSSSVNVAYTFDFGMHEGQTLYEVMDCNPSYFDWMFSPLATDLLDTRSNLVKGLRALPIAYLNKYPKLRDAMASRGILPLDLERPAIQVGRDAECRFWQATMRDVVRKNNSGPEVTMDDLDELFADQTAPVIVSLTSVMIRVEAPLGDFDLEQPY
ncbi:hypothetical protein CC86DRAFT_56545 [Ophiobolus disseminans]|uniref:Exodeoxyribonuclease X-like C-terminal domain-containing protein n=1 Tax=Ophiobolus disseminans TaxID=1469910 RepID=A0A6A6ZTW4_9PLEO|nr:hypothetical protein CC86DRAFT_56545 [Ophiobolus disseminans]